VTLTAPATPGATTTPPTPGPGQGMGDHHGGGEDNGSGDNGGDGHGQAAGCDATALVAGAVVHEADLKLTSTGNVWSEIKIVVNPPTTPAVPATT